jgi:hypothetical protein
LAITRQASLTPDSLKIAQPFMACPYPHFFEIVLAVLIRELLNDRRSCGTPGRFLTARFMSTMPMPPSQWAQEEFAFARLGDARRNKRLVKIAANLAAHPGGTLPQAFPEWAELKAAYRFFGQSGVTFQRVQSPHLERTASAVVNPGSICSSSPRCWNNGLKGWW